MSKSISVVTKGVHVGEKVPVRMPVDKSADQSIVSTAADDALFTQLYEQYHRPIRSYTYRLLGRLEDADDVTQEVFVRACASWSGLHEREQLSSWLYRIATNLCIDLLRRRKRISWWSLHPRSNDDGSIEERHSDLSPFLADGGGIPEIAERELIQLTLAQLPAEDSAILVLSAAQGIPYQEIATIIGISPNAAATRITRAKKRFAKQYQRLNQNGVDKNRPTQKNKQPVASLRSQVQILPRSSPYLRRCFIVVTILLVLVLLALGYWWWVNGNLTPETVQLLFNRLHSWLQFIGEWMR
jgi:RNA polymerase sigma-70 factor, ECF subfamily